MNGKLRQLDRTHDASLYSAVDLIVTRYHIEQAKTKLRRERARVAAPKRARARRAAADAAIEAAAAIEDSERRIAEMARLQDSAKASKKIAAAAISEREQVKRRMKVGFENPHNVEVGGRMRTPFVEPGLRSDSLGKAAKLFVRGCRKGARLRSANEKGFIMNQHRAKVLGLDYAWVEGNRDMVSLIRIDLDRFFESFGVLKALLQELVDAGRLPCLPHLVAGDVAPALDADGRIVDMLIKPHLWFVLPDAVNMKATGRRRPQRLLDAVYRGLCNVLLDLGVDPNAKALLVRGKNPLSPWWQSENFNDESFPSLSGYAAVLGDAMCVSLEQLARDVAEKQSGLPKAVSNLFFTAAAKEAWRILRDLHRRNDTDYLAALDDRNLLAGLLARLMPMEHVLLLGEGMVEPQRGTYVLGKVVGYAASRWSPEKADQAVRFRSRGSMKVLVAGAGTVRERQAVAGKAVAEARMQEARHAVLKAMDAVERSGAPFNQAEVARASGLNRKTVARHWRFCEARRPGRCVDKKGVLNPGMDDVPPAPGWTGAAVDGATAESSGVRNRKAPVSGRPVVARDSVDASPEPVVAVRQTNSLQSETALRLARKACVVRHVQAYVSGHEGAVGAHAPSVVAHREACPANPFRSSSSPVLPPHFTIRT